MRPRRGGARPAETRGMAMLQKRAQKIDKVIGRNIRIHRVGSGRLYQIAAILGVHVSTFFKGGETAERERSGESGGLLDLLAEPQSVRLIRAFSKITDTTVRRSLVQLAEKFAKTP